MKFTNDYVLTEVGNDVMAVPVGENAETSRRIVRLNATGAAVWRGIENGNAPNEIAAGLVKEYDGIDEQTALRHVNAVIEKLADAGLITE